MIQTVSFDYEVELINEFSSVNFETDEVGNQKPCPEVSKVLCGKKSVTRNEFYKAANAGLKPSLVLIVNRFEYSNQKKIKFDDEVYEVVRSYEEPGSDYVELVCESDISNRK